MAFFKKNKQVRTPKPTNRGSVVNTYYRAGTKTTSSSPFTKKTAKRSARKFLFGFLDIILLIILLLGLIYSLTIRPNPVVRVDDTSFHNLSDYQLAAKQQLQRLKNRNKLTFNEQSFILSLEHQFPELTDVNVELPLFSEQPKISLKVAKPSFRLNSRGVSYIINSDGVAVAKSAALPKVAKLVTINDQSGFYVNVGSRVISAQAVAFINTLIAESQQARVPIASLTLPKLAQELDLRTTDQTYYVKFYLGGDALTQAGQFLAARHGFGQSGQPPSQYLDVRITGKIFYK